MRYTHLFTPTESKGDNLHQYFTSNKYATCEILKRLASNNSEDDSVKLFTYDRQGTSDDRWGLLDAERFLLMIKL